MAELVAFRGLRFNEAKIGTLSTVLTPPYDVIDEIAQTRYYAENPANVIRLEHGVKFPQDSPTNNRYTRASQYLQKWIEDETLMFDPQPSFYIYRQEYVLEGSLITKTGLIAGLKLEPYENGNILPHEETHPRPRADRLQLMRTTKSNFSPIFTIYDDPDGKADLILDEIISLNPPAVIADDEDHIKHYLWIVDNKNYIKKLTRVFKDTTLYIADGHHRYESALEFTQQMQEQGFSGYDYIMSGIFNIHKDNTLILPAHRMICQPDDNRPTEILPPLAKVFKIHKIGPGTKLAALIQELAKQSEETHTLGMYYNYNLYSLSRSKAHSTSDLNSVFMDRASGPALFTDFVLPNLISNTDELSKAEEKLIYTRNPDEVIRLVDKSDCIAGFFIPPMHIHDIMELADKGKKMPPRSTFFYPKLPAGLVINHMK